MIFYISLIISLLIDLSTKYIAFNYLNEKIEIIGNYFYLQYFENTGIAFSMQLPYIKITTIILILGIFYYYFKEERKNNNIIIDLSFGLILGGAIGNGIERIINSKVIDFIGIKNFSIFNMADIFISIGAIIYTVYILKNNK
ncbi:MAG: signal peptidase II [Candidatus Gracilibacteria bacterium]|nr:signal peptidase II [Candidatus Gracilibacteria bacterium]